MAGYQGNEAAGTVSGDREGEPPLKPQQLKRFPIQRQPDTKAPRGVLPENEASHQL